MTSSAPPRSDVPPHQTSSSPSALPLHLTQFIGRARDLGFSIEEIRKLLALWQDRGRASADVKALALARATELKRKERALHEMRRSLEHLADTCQGNDRPDCPILGRLEDGPAALSRRKPA